MTGSTRYVGYVNGNDEGNPNGAVSDDGVAGVRGDDNTLLYIGATINTPIEGVAVGVAYDDRVWETSIGHQESDSVGVYAAYSLSDDVSISARYDIGTIEGSGSEDTFDNLTLILGYSIWENVQTRLELGWESGAGALATGAASPNRNNVYDGAPAGSSSYFALNAFYSF